MAPAAVAFATTPRFPSLRAVRAVAGDAEDEWGKETADQAGAAPMVAELKEALYTGGRGGDHLYTGGRGGDHHAARGAHPTPAPTEAHTLPNGTHQFRNCSHCWVLEGYLSLARWRTIDSENFTVQNCIEFSGPLATTSVSTNAKLDHPPFSFEPNTKLDHLIHPHPTNQTTIRISPSLKPNKQLGSFHLISSHQILDHRIPSI